jgi:DNA-binding NtrC family response regulator
MAGKEYRILIVEDEKNVVAGMELVLGDSYSLRAAGTLAGAREIVRDELPDLLILDLVLPDGDGADLLEELREQRVPVECVVVTGVREIDKVVSVMKLGVRDYLQKPFAREDLLLCVERAYEKWRLTAELDRLRSEVFEPFHWEQLVARSPAMRAVIRVARKMSRSDANVLITGESGTGKEMVARAIHCEGARSDGPFVAVNCAQFSSSLLESELFGHEKGAFTGATSQRHGRFELADGGTLFLDEVGNTSPEMQARILRVLETGRFERVGGEETISSDFRLLAATNAVLEADVAEGRFREDLYYRLRVVPIHIPPLRERRDDIEPLVEHFLAGQRARLGRNLHGFTAKAMKLLRSWRWPGNVRELRNVVEMAVALSDCERIGPDHFPMDILTCAEQNGAEPDARNLLEWRVQEFEKQLLVQELRRHDWNQAATARSLGCHRNTILNKIRKYGIDPGDGEGGERNGAHA